ncbi:hypothetical protein EDC94DRAFT_604675 [Helicostylum pulchrum]|uniref:F-box domain-containing protein n=1 Tax=Helicostylum pulchrum TaxID=562976 RepID=A0ABP9XKM2_9FUNG|nr:hypothetical protein EDC94DRAFT_604675 [Helicostylum pulchrum]
MSSLPNEILTLTFRHLCKTDVLQCQLTSKRWHEASLTQLYSDVCVDSDKKTLDYVRTISNSPALGKHLKTIDFYELFNKGDSENVLDECDILETIILCCPNITKIDTYNPDLPFWVRIRYAATQGQLSYLKTLPTPDGENLESYIYTALQFKDSLTSLTLSCDSDSFQPQLADLAAYGILYDQIDQFKNLQDLHLNYLCNKYLSYFDGLIDKCHHLKKLTFNVTIDKILQPNEPEPTVCPRPDIQMFKCNSRLINDDSQLEYLMYKFPCLKSLEVDSRIWGDHILNCSGHTLIKFIRYTLSIPDFEIQINVKEEDILNIWTEFINAKNECKNVSISYLEIDQPSDNLCILGCGKEGLTVILPSSTRGDELPHIRFFSEAGRSVRSLEVSHSNMSLRINGEASTNVDWLFEILQLCPIAEEIKICDLRSFSSSHHILQYPSVNKLTIVGGNYHDSSKLLDYVSLNLPNLKKLCLNFLYSKDNDSDPITINMPQTSLDLLTWKEKSSNIRSFKGTEVYIKLKTDEGLKFYMGERHMLFQIDSELYTSSWKHTRFDINCKNLTELRVRRSVAPKSDANLVF